MTDNLHHLKDDMTAFIEGHGMKRFLGYVTDEVASVTWEPGDNPEAWKDFVELARSAGATFLTMNDEALDKEDLDLLVDRLRQANLPDDDDLEEARGLRRYVNKTGFVQIGWPHQGVMFLYEVATEWYDRYQRLLDLAEDYSNIMIDEPGPEPE